MQTDEAPVPARWWTRWLGWLNIWKWIGMLAGLIAVGWMGRKVIRSRQTAADLEHVAKMMRLEVEAGASERQATLLHQQAEVFQQEAESHKAQANSLQASIEDRQARIDRLRKGLGV